MSQSVTNALPSSYKKISLLHINIDALAKHNASY